MADIFNIAGEINSTSREGTAVHANQVKDDLKNKKQSEVNQEVSEELTQQATQISNETTRAEGAEHTLQQQINAITGDNFVSVPAFTDLPPEGEVNTIYRVSSWDGTQVDASKYAEYAWTGSAYQLLTVRSAIGEVYDISANHPDGQGNPTPYADLAAALGASGANVPASVRAGGMQVKFIQRTGSGTTEDPYVDTYVQYRLMSITWRTTLKDWQGVDAEPTAGSKNLVESGGVQNELALGAVYDVSAHNGGTTFASLSALLSDANLNTLIPLAVRKGGMSVKFVQTSDNKYVQFFCTADDFTTDVTKWQGVDVKPIKGSKNLTESSGVFADEYEINCKIGKTALISDGNVNEYINLNVGIGYEVSLTPTTSVATPWKYYIQDVEEGDIVIVNGNGGNNPRLWGFIDSSNLLIDVADANASATNLRLIAPANSAKVIINDMDDYTSYLLRKSSIENQLANKADKEEIPLLHDTIDNELDTVKQAVVLNIDEFVNGYINLSGSTTDYSVNPSGSFTKCKVLDCTEGDVFELRNCGSSANARSYAFTDSSGNILEVAANGSFITGSIIAPLGTAKIVLNNLPSDTGGVIQYKTMLKNKSILSDYYKDNVGFRREIVPYFRGLIQFDGSVLDTANISLNILPFNEGDIIKVSSTLLDSFNFTVRKIATTSASRTNLGDENLLANGSKHEYQFTTGTMATIYWRKNDSSAFTDEEFNSFSAIVYRKQGRFQYKQEIHFAVKTNSSPCNSNVTAVDDGQTSANIPNALNGILKLPSTYTYYGKKTPLVMCCHGASGYVSDNNWYPGNAEDCVDWVASLLNNGYAVFDMSNLNGNTAGANDFGCPQLIEGYKNAITWIQEHYNVSDKVIIWSMSLGTFIGTNFINAYRELVSCYLMAGPRVSVKAFMDTLSPEGKTALKINLAKLFGFDDTSGATYEDDKMKPYDLYEQIVDIDSDKYLFKNFPPTKILAGANDTEGGLWATGYEDVFDALLNGGSNVTMRVVTGYNHSNICHIYGSELRSECRLFFDKYKL